jgi:putative transposase
MLLTYRYKLRPTKGQHALLDEMLERQRQLYNAALQERVEAWKKAGLSISKIDQNKSLTQVRSFDEAYAAVPVAMSRWSIARVDDAFKGFFGRAKRGEKPGFPRFKARARWKSFGFAEWNGVRVRGKRLLFAPFPHGLEMKLHRAIPDGALPKSCTFTKSVRHWHVSIAMDVPVEAEHPRPGACVGIDVGVEHLLTTSDGEHVENVRAGARKKRQLSIAQRALARCRRGSKRRRKVRERLARVQRSIANARSTRLHQVSARIARDHAFIAVEKLNVRNMTRSAKGTAVEPGTNVRQKAGLNRSMLDASTSRLIDFISYKAERAGGELVRVDARNTSQDCSACGARVPKELKQRIHKCGCGAELQRDHNAALNILERALVAHGRARPPGDANAGQRPVRRLGNAAAVAA